MYSTQMSKHGSNAFFEAVRVALGSFLTLLGIILATTTLIAVMSLIHGMDVYNRGEGEGYGGGWRLSGIGMRRSIWSY